MSDVTKNSNSGYERRDTSALKIAIFGGSALVLLVIVVMLIAQFFLFSTESLVYENVLKPESKDLRELRSREDQILNSYGVIDSTNGVYRIPIAHAMELMAEEAYSEKQP